MPLRRPARGVLLLGQALVRDWRRRVVEGCPIRHEPSFVVNGVCIARLKGGAWSG